MKRKVQPIEDKAKKPAEDKATGVWLRVRPGRAINMGGVHYGAGQAIYASQLLVDVLVANGYADVVREA
jgi:hypothetical protein